MKKFIISATLTSLLAASAFAGDMGMPGKNCPQGQTCLTGDMGMVGKTGESTTGNLAGSGGIFEIIKGYLDGIFG